MQPILIAVPQSNELQPFLSGLDRLGHPSQPIMIGNLPCYSIPSLGATAAVGGHGKTQFAVQCQYLIDRCDGLTALFCVGAAGSLSPDIHFGDVVVGECTIEHDYKIRFEPADPPSHAANGTLLNEFRQVALDTFPFRTHFGPIAGGDEDIVDEVRARELQRFTGANCVAWEGSGGARAAAFNGVPFLEIRCITDGADADAAASFRVHCERVLPHIADLVVQWRVTMQAPSIDFNPESSALTFREASSSDLDQLADWNHQLIRDEGHRNRMTVPELSERMRGWLERDYRAIVFELAETPVAYALFREQSNEIYLRQLFVVSERRRQGIGRQAVELLRTKVWPADKRLTVEVLTANAAAVDFWRSVGYVDYSLMLEILPPG